jgi:hypothetical protein
MKQVLEDYKKALEVCKELDFDEAYRYLYNNHLENGICFYCLVKDFPCNFISSDYIFKTPYFCNNHSEIIESLEFRINFLKQLS